MDTQPSAPITRLLVQWGQGEEECLGQLMPLVQSELRRIARRYMRMESPGHTLQTTALINEAYLKLVDQDQVNWQNRAHFFGISARIMRHILRHSIPGQTLGNFEIVEAIGRGGMGEVYRARDSKLGRDVALKVLPEVFARDDDRMARFQREAHLLASLNHPHIATIHELAESGEVRA